ncbi:MAG: ATP phosphoribosyltransferase regulatory subunit [Oscillospiraceae bacterium]|nr:ATP phosphoribosyltransferase regulatory subunit [Oscillospiraceae bacterium]
MNRFDLITPEGTRDLLFEECAAVKALEDKLLGMFRARGYSEVTTPGLEFYDVFDSKSRYFPQESMYKLVDNKSRLMVVRPDTTMPIARMAATRLREHALPIRLCYAQSVYRNRPGMRGRRDEIRQTGIELIGVGTKRAELEMLSLALDVLSSFDADGFSLELGHIGFFKALLSAFDSDTVEEIRSLIEYKNFPALNDLLDEYEDTDDIRAIRQLPRLFGGEDVIDKAMALVKGNTAAIEALNDLRETYQRLTHMNSGNSPITIDLGLVNRMDYYTGIVIKGYVEGFGEAVLSGGRYDRLLADFGLDVPATGFAVNTDSVSRALSKKHPVQLRKPDAVVFGTDGMETAAQKAAHKLISEGMSIEMAVFDTEEENREYAAKADLPLYIFREHTEQTAAGAGEMIVDIGCCKVKAEIVNP